MSSDLGKNSSACHFKGKHGKLYIIGKVSNCRFRKKIGIAIFLNSANKNCKMTAKMSVRHYSLDVVKPKCVGDF